MATTYEQLSLDLGMTSSLGYVPHAIWDKFVLEQDTLVVPEQNKNVLEQSGYIVPEHNSDSDSPLQYSHWIEEYSPSTRKKHRYYRYVWLERRKFHHIHIRGGNIRNPLVIERYELVRSAIALQKSPVEITDMIRAWGLSAKSEH